MRERDGEDGVEGWAVDGVEDWAADGVEGRAADGVEGLAAAAADTAMAVVVVDDTPAGSDDATLAICDDVDAGTRTPGLDFEGVTAVRAACSEGVNVLAAGESGAVELGRVSGSGRGTAIGSGRGLSTAMMSSQIGRYLWSKVNAMSCAVVAF